MILSIEELIIKYKLLVSPTAMGGWGAGIFQGSTGGHPFVDVAEEWKKGKRGYSCGRFCRPESWVEGATLEEAVVYAIKKAQSLGLVDIEG